MDSRTRELQFLDAAGLIEQTFLCFYQFESAVLARSHIYIGHAIGDHGQELQALGENLLIENTNELLISIRFSPRLVEDFFEYDDPTKVLTTQNLNSFLICAEEISHFHWIVNAAKTGRGISHFELELQGEIDKFLLASLFMLQQTGRPHCAPLARLLFDSSHIHSKLQHYHEANSIVAKFIWAILGSAKDFGLFERKTMTLLRAVSQARGSQKIRLLETFVQSRNVA